MSRVSQAEDEVGATLPTKTICHVYAIGGNSLAGGTGQYSADYGGFPGMSAAHKAKYWDVIHTGVWRLNNKYCRSKTAAIGLTNVYDMKYVQKIYEPLYDDPELGDDSYSAGMIIFPRLKELYSDSIHIGFCHVHYNGTGFRDTAGENTWNINRADPILNSLNLTKILGRNLDLTIKHLEAMGYDVQVKGILQVGQSGVDVEDMWTGAWTLAENKTAITEVINYWRTTLGYTDVPFYFNVSTKIALYPDEIADWNTMIGELNTELGNIHLHYTNEWAVLFDSTHINGPSGVNVWGEGAESNGHKNMAELIYSIETA